MKCPNCDTKIFDNATFCHNCGKLVDERLIPDVKGGSYGYVNAKGDIIIPHRYKYAEKFEEGLALVDSGFSCTYINHNGEEIIDWVSPDNEELGSYSEGLIYVGCWRRKSGYKYYNKYGKVAINEDLHSASDFKNGMALISYGGTTHPLRPVQDENGEWDSSTYEDEEEWTDRKWAFINKAGNIIKKLDYPFVEDFYDGMAIVNKNAEWVDGVGCFRNSYGYINEAGEEVIPTIYKCAMKFKNGYAAVLTDLGVWIFIDKEGRRISKRVYESVRWDLYYGFSNGLAQVSNYGKWGYIDTYGVEVITIKYEKACPFNGIYARVMLSRKWGLIDCAGNEVIPFVYDDIHCVGDKIFIAKRGDKIELLNADDNLNPISGEVYDAVDVYTDFIWVKCNDKWGVINYNGRQIIPCVYDDHRGAFYDGHIWVCKGGKWGTIDEKGNVLKPFSYDKNGVLLKSNSNITVSDCDMTESHNASNNEPKKPKWKYTASFFPAIRRKQREFQDNPQGFADWVVETFDNAEEVLNRFEMATSTNKAQYLFFDTETTGVPKNYKAPASDLNNWPRLVQLAWILCDEQGNEISSSNSIIKPNGFTIPVEASNVHGITTEQALQKGIDLKDCINKFIEVAKLASTIVCHNVAFDIKIVGAELLRIGSDFRIDARPAICTMLSSLKYCAIPSKNDWGDPYKWPKLQELHKKLFGVEFEDAHDAMADIQATKKCFFELRKRNIIKTA